MTKSLLSLPQASLWASDYLDKPVSISNISYLIQYAKIRKHIDEENKIKVHIQELKDYYDKNILDKFKSWKEVLGNDLNWDLSFSNLKEFETTKHVHRLHPYKGKFIPQLVEYFLDSKLYKHKK